MTLDNDFRLDYVPLDMDPRRGQHILTTDSLPDLIQTQTISFTQGTLPDLREGVEHGDDGESSPDSASQANESYMSESSDQPPKNWSINSNLDDIPPDETQERGRPRLAEPGTEIPVRSASVGNVRGVVTDSDYDHVKVMYFVNSKACFKTVGRDDYFKQMEAAEYSAPLQQAAQNSTPLPQDTVASPQPMPHYTGNILRGEANAGIRMHFQRERSHEDDIIPPRWNTRHAGDAAASPRREQTGVDVTQGGGGPRWAQNCDYVTKDGDAANPTVRHYATQDGDAANPMVRRQERGRSREKVAREKKELKLGDVVSVRSSSLGRHVDGIITDLSADLVRVQYFCTGRSCTKSLPRSAPEFNV